MFQNMKNSYYKIMADVTCQLMNPSKEDKKAYAKATAIGAGLGCMQATMAASDLTGSINSLAKTGFNILIVVANAYFILTLVLDILKYRSSDPQKSRMGKDGLVRGVICLVAVNMVGILIKAVINAAGNGNSGLGDQTSGTFGN